MRILSAILILSVVPALALAQPGTSTRAKKPAVASSAKIESPWSSMFRYSVSTDYADYRTPRGYTHALLGNLSYGLTKNWSLEASLGGRAQTIGGQISKGAEETYDEVLSPMTSLSVSYERGVFDDDKFSLSLEGEPLWDEASRQEGYQGIVGAGGSLSLRFFQKYLVISQDLSVSEMINSYRYGSDKQANPDYFWTYKLSSVVKIYKGFRGSYTFGAKVTRYMDDFIGYNYLNSLGLSYVWPHLTVALGYENGGFTDDGTISLWYIDQYRRLGKLTLGYTF